MKSERKKDCLNYCYDKGYNWKEEEIELYDILTRVSCWCCKNKNISELRNYYNYMPKYWNRLKEFQSKLDQPMKNKESVFQLEQRFKLEEEFLRQNKLN